MKLEAIIKIRPLSIVIPDNEDNQHVTIEPNGVSDFDIMRAAELLVEMMRMRIVDNARKELVESGIINPSKKEINNYINDSLSTRNDINGLTEE